MRPTTLTLVFGLLAALQPGCTPQPSDAEASARLGATRRRLQRRARAALPDGASQAQRDLLRQRLDEALRAATRAAARPTPAQSRQPAPAPGRAPDTPARRRAPATHLAPLPVRGGAAEEASMLHLGNLLVGTAQAQDGGPLGSELGLEITASVRDFAALHGGDPAAIFRALRDEFDVRLYRGRLLGPAGTLRARAGNDVDLSLCLAALLRAAGVPARLARGEARLGPEQIEDLLRTSEIPAALRALRRAGLEPGVWEQDGRVAGITLPRVFVEAQVPLERDLGVGARREDGQWVRLDPAAKSYERIDVRRFDEQVGLHPDVLLSETRSAALEDQATSTVQDLDPAALGLTVLGWGERVGQYLGQSGITVDNAYGDLVRVAEDLERLPAALPWDHERLGEVDPAELESRALTLRIGSEQSRLAVEELLGRTLTLRFEPETELDRELLEANAAAEQVSAFLVRLVPVLALDGEPLLEGDALPALPMGAELELEVTVEGPGSTRRLRRSVQVGSRWAFVVGAQHTGAQDLAAARARLSQAAAEGDARLDALLHAAGTQYLYTLDRLRRIAAGAHGVRVSREPALVAAGVGLQVEHLLDVPVQAASGPVTLSLWDDPLVPTSLRGDEDRERSFAVVAGLLGSVSAALVLDALLADAVEASALSPARTLASQLAAGGRSLTAEGGAALPDALAEAPELVRALAAEGVAAGWDVTVPLGGVPLGAEQVWGLVRLDPDFGGGEGLLVVDEHLVVDAALPQTALTPAQLALPLDAAALQPWAQVAERGLDLAPDWLGSLAAVAIAGIATVQRWFEPDPSPGPLTTAAAILALSVPLDRLASRPVLAQVVVGPDAISPGNAHGGPDAVDISAAISQRARWTVRVVATSDGEEVLSEQGEGVSVAARWAPPAGTPDGEYRVEILATGARPPHEQATPAVRAAFVDGSPPALAITGPADAPGQPVVGNSLAVFGSVQDTTLLEWALERGAGDPPQVWERVATGEAPIEAGRLAVLGLDPVPNGVHTLRLRATDRVGNAAEVSTRFLIDDPDKDIDAPTVSFVSPAEDDLTLRGELSVEVVARDDRDFLAARGPELVVTLDETETLCERYDFTGPEVRCAAAGLDSTRWANGPHELVAVAVDNRRNAGRTVRNVRLDNPIHSFVVTPNPFSPNDDGVDDVTRISARLRDDDAWSLILEASATGAEVQRFEGPGDPISVTWDGTDAGGQAVPDGVYVATLSSGEHEVGVDLVLSRANSRRG